MNNKKSKLKITMAALAVSISALSHTAFIPAANTYAMTSNPSTQILPMSDRIVWRYKKINGILYKRLYNITKEKWIGNWIKV